MENGPQTGRSISVFTLDLFQGFETLLSLPDLGKVLQVHRPPRYIKNVYLQKIFISRRPDGQALVKGILITNMSDFL